MSIPLRHLPEVIPRLLGVKTLIFAPVSVFGGEGKDINTIHFVYFNPATKEWTEQVHKDMTEWQEESIGENLRLATGRFPIVAFDPTRRK